VIVFSLAAFFEIAHHFNSRQGLLNLSGIWSRRENSL
jgi:hypothetical protein